MVSWLRPGLRGRVFLYAAVLLGSFACANEAKDGDGGLGAAGHSAGVSGGYSAGGASGGVAAGGRGEPEHNDGGALASGGRTSAGTGGVIVGGGGAGSGHGGTSGAKSVSGTGGIAAGAGAGGSRQTGGTAGAAGTVSTGGKVSTGGAPSAGTSGAGGGGEPQFDPRLLVPEKGALLGLYYGDASISATATKLGRTIPLHLTYYAWEDDFTRAETKKDLDAGRIPFINWELFGGELDEILAGTYDAMIDERAADTKALNAPVFIDFGAEMNGDWSPWGGAQNGESPDKYVAVYRKVHDAFRDAGADNAIWTFCPNVTDEPRESWNEALGYYPGDAYVDWMCVDGYNWGTTNGGGWQSFERVFRDIYPKLAAKNKPIMIGEMASAEQGGDKAAWIDAIIPTLTSRYPAVRGLIWFDVNKETDWRVSSSSATEAAFERMANDPYFNP